MIPEIPFHINAIFMGTVLLTFILFYRILSQSNLKENLVAVIRGLIIWLAIQAALSFNLFYLDTVKSIPPPFPFIGFIPSFILITVLFSTAKGRAFIDSLPMFDLTLLSIVRIPVEIVLYWLFIQKAIPEAMTYSGYNFDILAGITAPFVAYFGYKDITIGKPTLLLWNVVSLLLLITIILLSVFAFPSVIQQYAFDQPNVGMLYFPFFWLPSFIVPIVFFSHLVMIRRLVRN